MKAHTIRTFPLLDLTGKYSGFHWVSRNPRHCVEMATTVITNFDKIAILAPRPGLFVGGCVYRDGETPEEATNPIVRHYELSQAQNIPQPPPMFLLGSLSQLPVEILYDIILYLDFLSVISFRNVNRWATSAVASLHEFNLVLPVPKVMSAVIHMQCRFFSLGQLANNLHDTRCRKCEKHFGELLYLISGERICWSCWRRYSDFIPKTSKKNWQFEVSLEALEAIPHIKGIPGKYGYSPPYGIVKVAGRIFDRCAAAAEQDKMITTQEKIHTPTDPELEPERARLRAPKSAADAAYVGNSAWPGKPMPTRYIAFLRAPYFDNELKAFVGGYFCRACIGRNRFSPKTYSARSLKFPASIWHEPWRRYTRDGFWEHVQKYGQIFKDGVSGEFVHDSPQRET